MRSRSQSQDPSGEEIAIGECALKLEEGVISEMKK